MLIRSRAFLIGLVGTLLLLDGVIAVGGGVIVGWLMRRFSDTATRL